MTDVMHGNSLLAVGPVALGLLMAAAMPACGQTPSWLKALDYTSAELSHLRVGSDGFPYVRVRLDRQEFWVLFDTGNMVGLTLATPYYDSLSLKTVGTVHKRDSSGELVGESRVGIVRRAEVLGHERVDARVHEFDHPRLVGLLGPNDLPGTRFTLDYQTGVLAVSSTALPGRYIEGVRRSLVRSRAHPRLVLVEGSIRGRSIIIELDTGKSRAVVDPGWATEAGVAVRGDTVGVGTVQIGELSLEVTNAKPVSLGAIDPDLPLPLALSLGSDMLSRYLITVDYATGVVVLSEIDR